MNSSETMRHDPDTMSDNTPIADSIARIPTRRRFLTTASAAGVAMLAGCSGAPDVATAIPAPFDSIPTVDDPTGQELATARGRYSPEAVPKEGEIPDPYHEARQPVTLTVPEWAIEATRWRLEETEDVGRSKVKEILRDYVVAEPTFETEGGTDAIDELVSRLSKEQLEEDVDL